MDWKGKRKLYAWIAGGSVIAVWVFEPMGLRPLAMLATIVFIVAALLWILSLFLGGRG